MLFLLVILLAQTSAPSRPIESMPRFESYPVVEKFKGTPARPILRTSEQRSYRTRIREGAKKGPNFAGHYTIVEWGCGSGCLSIAIVDAATGMVWDDPFHTLIFGTGLKYDLALKDAYGNYIDDKSL